MTEPSSNPARHGLTQSDAEARLAADGPNELSSAKKRSILAVAGGVLREPMLLFLLGAGAIYLVLGELHDALILMAFAGLTIVIAVVQEARTEKAIDALRDLSMPQALVIRDGRRQSIRSRDVVRGDLLVLSEGGRVAADGWVIEADTLQADEAILTGESVAVTKAALKGEEPNEAPVPGGDGIPYAYSGTLVVRGAGLLRVAATGPRTRIGAIGQSLSTLGNETPRLTLQTRKLVRWFAAGGIGVSVLAILLYGFLRGSWVDALLSGIALAMSLLPEELPVVLTLFMTMGALRMSRSRVLARRGTAIETLGAATVLCTDKTGTLTQNRMQVEELRLPGGEAFRPDEDGVTFPEPFRDLARAGILACPEEPFDPMEKAFHQLDSAFPNVELKDRQDDGWTLHHHYPLAPELLAMTHVWTSNEQDGKLVAAKGAPEAIAELCGLDGAERHAMEASVAEMAERGLRILGVAQGRWEDGELPESQRQFDFAFAGLVGLADPLRESVPEAVRTLQGAGIRVVMITGDYPATARAIAAKAGIAEGGTLTGDEIKALGDEDLAAQIGTIAVFSRVMPEQKLRIVRALKAAGEVVAMTGDGVNDAPSLKAAHIGVAMGQRGTDVAREASSLVLLDDDFKSIPVAVRLGRRIYDNIRKATEFIFAVHLPIGGLAIAPLLTGWPIILGPVHIALLEMIIDPICSLSFEAEPEEADIMRREPRDPESPLVTRALLEWSVLQGGLALVFLVALAAWTHFSGMEDELFRATCFAGLICTVLVLVFINRSFRIGKGPHRTGHNLTFFAILGVTGAIYASLFLMQPVADLFHFAVLDMRGIAAVGVMVVALASVLALAKRHYGRGIAR